MTAVSVDDVFGKPPAPAPVAPANRTAVSADDVFGKASGPKESKSPIVDGLWGAFHDHLTSLAATQFKNQDEALGLISQGVKDMQADRDETKVLPLQNWKGLGEGLLGVMNLALSPFSTLVEEAASKPTAAIVNKIGSLVSVNNTPVARGSVDWSIRQSDVQETTKHINEFMDTLYNTATGLMGGGGMLKKAGTGAYDLLTPEARAEMQARPVTAAAKVEGAYNVLSAVDPAGAQAVADKVAQVDPKTAKYMQKNWQKFVVASDKELEQLGQANAQANVAEIEGDYNKLKAKLQADQKPPPQQVQVAEKAQEEVSKSMASAVPEEKDYEFDTKDVSEVSSLIKEWLNSDWEPELDDPKAGAGPKSTSKAAATPGSWEELVESAGGKPAKPNKKSTLSLPPKQKLPHPDTTKNDLGQQVVNNAGRPIHPTAEGVKNFWKWFGDSQLKDKDGRPIVLYHTTEHDIYSFDIDKNAENAYATPLKFVSFTTDPAFDAHWVGANNKTMYPVYAVAKNLGDYRNPEHLALMLKEAKENPEAFKSKHGDFNYETTAQALKNGYYGVWEKPELWKKFGWDGAFMHEYNSSGNKGALNVSLAKAQNRIKSAIGNSGQFDPNMHTLMHSGINVPEAVRLARATRPGQILEGKLRQYYDSIIRHINPEALGQTAKKAAAIIAKGIATLAREDSKYTHQGEQMIRYWEGHPDTKGFIERFERGDKFTDPKEAAAAQRMREWNDKLVEQDRRSGVVEYQPEDHYLSHMYEDPEAARKALDIMYGSSWTRPGFTKDRIFKTYADALKAGKVYEAKGEKNPFKPRFTNPEMIMQARQHASDLAEMKVQILRDLESKGLAVEKVKGKPAPGPEYSSKPSPTGKSYWVKNDAYQVLFNAFDSKSMWNMQGITGDLFRGAMFLKNAKVQAQLGMSLYHFLHIGLGMDSSTEMVRATKEMLAGKENPLNWFKRVVTAPVGAFYSNPRMGGRLMRAYRGQIADGELTAYDKQSLRFAAEGGFIPEMSSQYRTKALDNFHRALAGGSAKAAWHLPFAAMELTSKWMFDHWIPNLKFASYTKDVQTALKVNPSLIHDDMARMEALRKIAKSVDNRYGEMAYNTMFWKRWVKDLAVANTLSLGWQVGLVREFGGGMLDLGHALTTEGGVAKKASTGMLDRPLMITAYTTQALGIGGLMTWAMTGEPPKDLKDYYLPRTGDTNRDGTPARVNTMFYTKEFASLAKHIETQGLESGLQNLVTSKASGLIGLAVEGIKGTDEWGNEIRDPDAPLAQKVGQTLTSMMPEVTPISLEAIKSQPGGSFTDKVTNNPSATARSVAGFTPAPKYMTESKTDAAIDQTYKTYYAPKQTPFQKAEYGKEYKELRQLYESDDTEGFDKKLDEVQDRFQLTNTEARKLRTRIEKGGDANISKFKEFTWQQQKKLLDQMTPEERDKYLPHSNKQHLRNHYEAPEVTE